MSDEQKQIDDGGPAFPQNDASVNRANNHDGMSLRDAFAMHALQSIVIGCMANDDAADALLIQAKHNDRKPEQQMAIRSYRVADAMLAARKQSEAI